MQDDPIWLDLETMLAVHEDMLRRYGGAAGIRDRNLLESALGRARHQFAYGETDWCALAASYANGIVNNHPFIDGNKRTGFIAAGMFLELNGLRLTASPAEAAVMTLALADKSVNEAAYAQWLRDNNKPQP